MDYCISVNLIPSRCYDEICSNINQIEEWNTLFGLNLDINATIHKFIKKNPFLPIDTQYFSQDFIEIIEKEVIISGVEGVVINGSNIEVLNNDKFKEIIKKFQIKIACLYTDPPYNRAGVDKPGPQLEKTALR